MTAPQPMDFKAIAAQVYELANSPTDPLATMVKEALTVIDEGLDSLAWRAGWCGIRGSDDASRSTS